MTRPKFLSRVPGFCQKMKNRKETIFEEKNLNLLCHNPFEENDIPGFLQPLCSRLALNDVAFIIVCCLLMELKLFVNRSFLFQLTVVAF